MRADALGLWWRDEPIVKVTKTVVKRTPPDPVWLKSDYLPGLAEALAFPVHVMTDTELLEARSRKDKLIFDIECYENYYLAAFTSLVTGWVSYVEMTPDYPLDDDRLLWLLQNFTIVGFNSYHYDLPITAMALAGKSCQELKLATNMIILQDMLGSDVLKAFKVKKLKDIDHIDLIEVAPLVGSLKTYGGRLHVPRMQDLPFHHAATLSPQQMAIVRWYCVNDLTNTAFLHESLKEQLALRERMRDEYGIDMRSRSDAQMAEAVIAAEVSKLNGRRAQKPKIELGTHYRYHVPQYMKFYTPLMQDVLQRVAYADFIVGDNGKVGMPAVLADFEIRMANGVYRMGIGGLHSSEEKAAHQTDANHILVDRDVASYYPRIILNLGLFPQHLGTAFLHVYNGIVDKRIAAKRSGDKVTAESLKITINGSFGKFGNQHSVLYAPDLLIQVTLTGQLALLMLIERMELSGITVISANTDGLVIKCPRPLQSALEAIFKQWEQETGFETEETRYRAYYGRDVNNYIAIKEDGKTKNKGAYSNPWGDPKQAAVRLHKNPVTTICVDAVEALLVHNTPILQTIKKSKDVRKFICVRNVKGGAVKNGEFLGKVIRWYYATEQSGEMVYASSGNKVPRSDGAKPLMLLPDELPIDIDYDWYEREANSILVDIGYNTA